MVLVITVRGVAEVALPGLAWVQLARLGGPLRAGRGRIGA
jgi:hypothetical protein